MVYVILVKRKRGKILIFKYLTPTSGLRIAFPRDKTIKILPTLRDIIDLSPRLTGKGYNTPTWSFLELSDLPWNIKVAKFDVGRGAVIPKRPF